jgi:hypothetical protein
MSVTIGLERHNYEQLLHNLASESAAYNALRRCPELYRWGRETPLFKCVIVECNGDEAMVLLEAANQHCPEAVADIKYGLKLSGAFE